MDQKEMFTPYTDSFAARHIGLSKDDEQAMLKQLGAESLEDLGKKILPSDIHQTAAPKIGDALSESEAKALLEEIASENQRARNFIGCGYYGTRLPEALRRNMLESPSWYTAYTPYQPEIAQGRLEMLLNFQTMISDLTGMELSNASLLDEATAAAEAMTMLRRESASTSKRFLVDAALFPQTLAVLKTRAEPQNMQLVVAPPADFPQLAAEQQGAFGALFGYPSGTGEVRDDQEIVSALSSLGICSAVNADLLALTILRPPAEAGFVIATGSAQRFGLPLGFGGPHAGYIAFDKRYRRLAPGRIVGVSKDASGAPCFRLALQTREQHIRREKATSNICTAQALPAMLAAAYAIFHGPKRLRAIAGRAHRLTVTLAEILKKSGKPPKHSAFFDTLHIETQDASKIVANASEAGFNFLLVNQQTIGVSIDELTRREDIEQIARFLHADQRVIAAALTAEQAEYSCDHTLPELIEMGAAIPPQLIRRQMPLTHPVFNRYHSEHEITRYLRRLSARDIALDRSMMPLGSCTMKLNAAAEMAAISLPEFADIHPLAPPPQTRGYARIAKELREMLAQLSGFDAVSLQPNSGAQGEYLGLLAIRAYHQSRGEQQRRLCLIPESAHGTNPASAAMAGMRVLTTKINAQGELDLAELRENCTAHADELAALMITYPSTCGTFGANIQEVCSIVHQTGAQVYMDGANFNAIVGLAFPGQFGPDVMHINLHKTFCVPHGGGGPGMGPIAMKRHLAEQLPLHPFTTHSRHAVAEQHAAADSLFQQTPDKTVERARGAVSAAPLGSGLLLLISWMYCRMMGGEGLRRASLTALLTTNYMAKKVSPHFPLLFHDTNSFVAHECVMDARPFKKSAGINVEDIAKRLIDFGLHAPTVSWPIPGTIMIEPTESENKAEIDRYCSALAHIRKEINQTAAGENGWTQADNPLKNAPHTAQSLLAEEWPHAYSRQAAAFPEDWVADDKYWPPVERIDQAWGDRNLVCSCLPIEQVEESVEKNA